MCLKDSMCLTQNNETKQLKACQWDERKNPITEWNPNSQNRTNDCYIPSSIHLALYRWEYYLKTHSSKDILHWRRTFQKKGLRFMEVCSVIVLRPLIDTRRHHTNQFSHGLCRATSVHLVHLINSCVKTLINSTLAGANSMKDEPLIRAFASCWQSKLRRGNKTKLSGTRGSHRKDATKSTWTPAKSTSCLEITITYN